MIYPNEMNMFHCVLKLAAATINNKNIHFYSNMLRLHEKIVQNIFQ